VFGAQWSVSASAEQCPVQPALSDLVLATFHPLDGSMEQADAEVKVCAGFLE
jgi:hypothetical protein